MMYAYHERDCWPHMIKPRGLCASWKKSFSLANKQKSDLFFCISLELFINNALFGQEIFVGLGRRLSSSAMLLT